MNVLILCELSGQLRRRFYDAGHNVMSCDTQPCDDPEHPSAVCHYEGDAIELLEQSVEWDLIIMHPPCTALTVAGNHKYAKDKPGYTERLKAIQWTVKLWELAKLKGARVCLENPVSVVFQHLKGAIVQYIQPHDYGEDASKRTGLALHNLKPLKPTKRIPGRIVNGKERWANQTDSGQNKLGPSPTRAKDRSKTYDGIADAIVNQWGGLESC
jgi:hypothetical protein